MKYIAQRDSDDCVIASIAMVTDRAYEEVRALCDVRGGLHSVIADDILGELGYAVMRRYKWIPRLKQERAAWPCEPFAPAHLAEVMVAAGAHAVAMDADGRVFDPWKADRTTLRHPDYLSVGRIDGVFLVRP